MQQQIDDARKHGIDLLLHLEHKWGSFLGREIFNDCRISLKRPMQLLTVFEEAGKRAEEKGEFLSWTVPVTGFPVVQNYTEGVVKKVHVKYGPKTTYTTSKDGKRKFYNNDKQLAICFIEEQVPSKRKQAQGASPNGIHSLDAAHLTITVDKAPFTVVTVHDSFGSSPCDMPHLFRLIRETFVTLYQADPLTSMMEDIGGDLSNVILGDLDITLVLDSEYCFV